MTYTDKIQDFLEKNDYQIVQSFSTQSFDILQVHIPARKLEPVIEPINILYKCMYDENKSGIQYLVDGSDEDFIECSRYCIERFIALDIERVCERIYYDTSLIRFKIDEQNVSEKQFKSEFFKYQMSDEEQNMLAIVNMIIDSVESGAEFPVREEFDEEHFDSAYHNTKTFYGL